MVKSALLSAISSRSRRLHRWSMHAWHDIDDRPALPSSSRESAADLTGLSLAFAHFPLYPRRSFPSLSLLHPC